jgi:hypothetical protein
MLIEWGVEVDDSKMTPPKPTGGGTTNGQWVKLLLVENAIRGSGWRFFCAVSLAFW